MLTRLKTLAALAIALTVAEHASAVLILQSANRNTSPPPGSMATAWNLEGQFGLFSATPIGPEHFIAAKHIGGSVGQAFLYGTQSYNTTGFTDIAGTDLRIWHVDTIGGTHKFPAWASIWNPTADGSELGKSLVVFGRGTARGDAVYAPINPGTTVGSPPRPSMVLTGDVAPLAAISGPAPTGQGDLRGWKWGAVDVLQSWGQNKVEFAITDPNYGKLIGFNFDSGSLAGPNEAILSRNDSSGGVFAQAASGQWKLIGVNLGVDSGWSFTAPGPYFDAALFDARGLFIGSTSASDLVPYANAPTAASSYSTSVSNYYGQLSTITNGFGGVSGGSLVPEPSAMLAAIVGGLLARGRGRRRAFDAANQRARGR